MSEKQLVSTSEIARLIDTDRTQTLSLLKREGLTPTLGKKQSHLYPLEDVLRAYAHDVKSNQKPGKARREAALAEKEEILLANLKKELMPVTAVRNIYTLCLSTMFKASLSRLPRTIPEAALNFAKAEKASSADITAAVRTALVEFWSDVNSGEMFTGLDERFKNTGINEGEK